MDRLEAAKYIKAHCLGSEVCRDGTRWNDAMMTAVEALEGKDIDVPAKDDAIPVDWLMKKADWCDKNNGIFVSGAIRSAVDAWREEQNNGIDKS